MTGSTLSTKVRKSCPAAIAAIDKAGFTRDVGTEEINALDVTWP